MIPMLLQMFGPVLAGLLKNLGERAIAGWKTSAIKASVSVAAVEGLAVSMGCDVSSLEAGMMAVPAALLSIFEVPANMAMPTILDAMRKAVEEKRQSDAVLADAQKQQDDAAKKFGIQSWLPLALLFLTGCTTVHDLSGGRYIVPRAVEVRSPFGTNAGFVMLETCDGIKREEAGLQPIFPTIEYVNCLPMTGWQAVSSQGQGGQIVSGVLQTGAILGAGAMIQVPSATASSIQNVTVTAPKGKH